ncbi:hypothetical protein P7K49_029847, partial [Saguinus oedipus]
MSKAVHSACASQHGNLASTARLRSLQEVLTGGPPVHRQLEPGRLLRKDPCGRCRLTGEGHPFFQQDSLLLHHQVLCPCSGQKWPGVARPDTGSSAEAVLAIFQAADLESHWLPSSVP